MALQEPKLYTLNEVLHDRLFQVPPYQRGYSWTEKERRDLFEDLQTLRELRRDEHFMATLVFRDTRKHVIIGGTDRLRIYDVVDGQQRLTTLVILLKAIEKNLIENHQKKQADKIDAILVKEKKDLILLQTNHDARDTLDAYLRQGDIGHLEEAITLHQRELMNAFRECEQFVVDWGNPVGLLDLLKNKIKFVFFVLENPGAVYTVFEVLNSRGLNVDWLDKMKSTLMGVAFQKKRKLPAGELDHVEDEWTAIYRVLGKEVVSDADVLTFAANLTADEPPAKGFQEVNALEFFREEAHQDKSTPLETSKFLRQLVTTLDQFLKDPRHQAICRIKQPRLLATALLISDRLRKDSKSQQKAMVAWENAMFRFYVLGGGDARDRVGECIRLASEIRNGNLSLKQILNELGAIGNVTHQEVAAELEKRYVYDRWTAQEIIYFFWKYEERLSAENDEIIDQITWGKIWENASKEKSVEHIFPQKDPNDNWKGKGRQNVNPESFVHRLGNLLVLPPGLNSKAGTKSFADKIEVYKSAKGLHHVKKVMRLKDWNLAAIEKREKELMQFAEEQWWR
ncbi:MAG TPA: DUF262 domain-containing HNH endonuclease family protein [Candidatus Udaeobacter sp.]|jgi:hypothetical protein